MTNVVIGVGNPYRRDDGIGPAVAAEVARQQLPGVRVLACPTEPAAVLDAWAGSRLAVVVDASVGGPPGRVRRCAPAELTGTAVVSSHDLNLAQTYELATVLGRAPQRVVVVTVAAADTGHGEGLSPAVAAALPEAVRAVLDVLIQQGEESADQQS